MADALITEHAGTRRGEISRFYQYGSGGVRVMDAKKAVKRLYLFDPSSDSMTERDPFRNEKVLRRFVFDRYGMLEETFAFGARPRTFRYENGASRIAVREGGEYGAVGKIFTFEQNGITETAWGRNGEIERVYQFDAGGDAITIRAGGWFGDVDRTIVFSGIEASLFLEPEAFLQFLMFTEWSASDREADVNERVAGIRSREMAGSPRSRFAYTSPGRTPGDGGVAGGRGPDSRIPAQQNDARSGRTSRGTTSDAGIDYIPDADAPGQAVPKAPASRQSSGISFEERWHRPETDDRKMSLGKSVEIPFEERFGSSRGEREELSKGKSVEIPFEERFGSARGEREELSRGKSVEIPLEERFESARREREKLSKGKSAEIPYDERRSGGNR
ncbi:MAG TPA: hypothetical protein VFC43_06660 [Methanoregula sp.]|nr:hypothetical protein [Methanoregula sp.]